MMTNCADDPKAQLHQVGGLEVIRTLSRVVQGVNGSLGWEAIGGSS